MNLKLKLGDLNIKANVEPQFLFTCLGFLTSEIALSNTYHSLCIDIFLFLNLLLSRKNLAEKNLKSTYQDKNKIPKPQPRNI